MTPGFRLDIFCRVVDNFGDAGVCWRLARQLAAEYPVQVRLWIDRLETLQKISPAVDADNAEQLVSGVTIRHWPRVFPEVDAASIPDVVIEGFGCRLPDNYLSAMAHCHRQPVWINMEYLSAESWVGDCHGMASPQSSLPLTRHFFFPGFTEATGGLFREAGLMERRARFQADDAGKQAFLAQLGVKNAADYILSLFCYDDAPVTDLFRVLAAQKEKSVLCLVPEGVAGASVSRFLGRPAKAGETQSEEALTVQVIPMVSQDEYDRLLWSCDLNFVRGEDSFLRAQWAVRPFVWQIYPQDEEAHILKLDAFLTYYFSEMPDDMAKTVGNAWRAWNGIRQNKMDAVNAMREMVLQDLPALTAYGVKWGNKLAAKEDFAASLFRFINGMR